MAIRSPTRRGRAHVEVTKFKFATGVRDGDSGAAWKSTDEWRQYLEGLVKEQREAKEAERLAPPTAS